MSLPPHAAPGHPDRPKHYNAVAASSIERVAALSDGVFAVALTLLVLDLHAPALELVHSEADLWNGLVALAPRLAVYVMSFMTLGIFWVGQQTQHNNIEHSDRNLAWLHLAFLFAVTLMPFSTTLTAEFIRFRLAVIVYWLNILLLGGLLWCAWRYARAAGLVSGDADTEIARNIERRITIAQALYAVGALLCLFDTYASLGFIALVQVNYVVAPRIGVLARI